jgi:hypothetical protein
MAKQKAKPKLKAEKKVMFKVEEGDLTRFVQQVYDENYEFVAVEECGNDSSHTFSVTGIINEYDAGAAKTIRNGEVPTYRNGLLLDVLCADGYIEPGEYVVEVCW